VGGSVSVGECGLVCVCVSVCACVHIPRMHAVCLWRR